MRPDEIFECFPQDIQLKIRTSWDALSPWAQDALRELAKTTQHYEQTAIMQAIDHDPLFLEQMNHFMRLKKSEAMKKIERDSEETDSLDITHF